MINDYKKGNKEAKGQPVKPVIMTIKFDKENAQYYFPTVKDAVYAVKELASKQTTSDSSVYAMISVSCNMPNRYVYKFYKFKYATPEEIEAWEGKDAKEE
jgi:hypothetical protein